MKHWPFPFLALCLLFVAYAGGAFSEPSRPALQTELLRGYYLSSTESIHNAFKLRLDKYTQIRRIPFMGYGVLMHEVTRQPLACVEKHIRAHCEDYAIRELSGWRAKNSFKPQTDIRRQEYSNHIFGLALDINPKENPCCGCTKRWANNPRCLAENGAQVFDKGAPIGKFEIPRCWVAAFKRYGFHWLGDDALRDTMHFEFLAEPGTVSCP